MVYFYYFLWKIVKIFYTIPYLPRKSQKLREFLILSWWQLLSRWTSHLTYTCKDSTSALLCEATVSSYKRWGVNSLQGCNTILYYTVHMTKRGVITDSYNSAVFSKSCHASSNIFSQIECEFAWVSIVNEKFEIFNFDFQIFFRWSIKLSSKSNVIINFY